ncbi:hypothetical protein F7725_025774 [Dissostichus mawsoni]|uniref:Uncharacterized protein n=1 Tax=Dissostichus mawsoni TaxID=36200 RepID=A0A7J5X607_DISMA|nr:hypothetical protein F7725_025774 [Dissostichus mawsoni]
MVSGGFGITIQLKYAENYSHRCLVVYLGEKEEDLFKEFSELLMLVHQRDVNVDFSFQTEDFIRRVSCAKLRFIDGVLRIPCGRQASSDGVLRIPCGGQASSDGVLRIPCGRQASSDCLLLSCWNTGFSVQLSIFSWSEFSLSHNNITDASTGLHQPLHSHCANQFMFAGSTPG